MKIKRTIEGKEIEIELTNEEMVKAYNEQEKNYHYDDILSRLDDMENKPENLTQEDIDLAVKFYEKYLGYEDGWFGCASDAIYKMLEVKARCSE